MSYSAVMNRSAASPTSASSSARYRTGMDALFAPLARLPQVAAPSISASTTRHAGFELLPARHEPGKLAFRDLQVDAQLLRFMSTRRVKARLRQLVLDPADALFRFRDHIQDRFELAS